VLVVAPEEVLVVTAVKLMVAMAYNPVVMEVMELRTVLVAVVAVVVLE
jgi:hypothetical protein